MVKKVYISSDHGGFQLKNYIIEQLEAMRDDHPLITKLEITDLGPEELDAADDYPPYAFDLAEQVVANGVDAQIFGVLICRSGIGMSIAANKVDGAYAALCNTIEVVRVSRQHNDANILVLDADYGHQDPVQLVLEFLSTDFSAAPRHIRRVEQIKQYELSTTDPH